MKEDVRGNSMPGDRPDGAMERSPETAMTDLVVRVRWKSSGEEVGGVWHGKGSRGICSGGEEESVSSTEREGARGSGRSPCAPRWI